MNHLSNLCLLSFLAICLQSIAFGQSGFEEHISKLNDERRGTPVRLKKHDIITTRASFQTPVEIKVEAKTDDTNLRLSYAADQLIFNWEVDRGELVVNGGPAKNVHKKGAGLIPAKKYVVIRWVVTKTGQSIYVDDQLRYEHQGDYSAINKPVTVFSAGSELTVKSIQVKTLAP
jgi:hypothetical protein